LLQQDLSDNRLYEFPSEKGKGVVGAIIFHAVLIAILIIAGITSTPPQIEEGLLVNFGTDDFGSGLVEPSQASAQESAPPPQPSTPVAATSQEKPVDTQEYDEEAPPVKKVTQTDPDAERKRQEALEAEKKRLEAVEAERQRQLAEEAERKRIEEEERKAQAARDRISGALSGANTATKSTGEGTKTGTGNEGVKTGSVDATVRGDGSGLGTKGLSYDLAGRTAQSLPPPKYELQVEGIVVVEITVDRAGKVTAANPGVKGSTTLDENLLRVAREAALLARFDAKPDAQILQKGTITYHFILK
jgi:colicin import membrane protein